MSTVASFELFIAPIAIDKVVETNIEMTEKMQSSSSMSKDLTQTVKETNDESDFLVRWSDSRSSEVPVENRLNATRNVIVNI